MATFSFAKRTSTDYRFTIESLDDAALADFRQMVKNLNEPIKKVNNRIRSNDQLYPRPLVKEYRVLIRPRGPRFDDRHHTLMAHATHYDVYIGRRSIEK